MVLRYAALHSCASLCQPPPRRSRCEPVAGPCGSRAVRLDTSRTSPGPTPTRCRAYRASPRHWAGAALLDGLSHAHWPHTRRRRPGAARHSQNNRPWWHQRARHIPTPPRWAGDTFHHLLFLRHSAYARTPAHRPRRHSRPGGPRQETARMRPHDGHPLGLGHGIFPQVEGLTDGHLATLACARRSHGVRPGRNQDELHAQTTDERVHA